MEMNASMVQVDSAFKVAGITVIFFLFLGFLCKRVEAGENGVLVLSLRAVKISKRKPNEE